MRRQILINLVLLSLTNSPHLSAQASKLFTLTRACILAEVHSCIVYTYCIAYVFYAAYDAGTP